ncbi:hypothetical protein GDO81_006397 [Engystomops pustulosus]|uniref:Uncharacterized protein n=1 Tax=Engystomops pustulosus TaxID=76066 RepID=A0AAV7CXZ1_ENGPU|nr:hypothetical protein GDO81_006397 [Engystomops pustulosus]
MYTLRHVYYVVIYQCRVGNINRIEGSQYVAHLQCIPRRDLHIRQPKQLLGTLEIRLLCHSEYSFISDITLVLGLRHTMCPIYTRYKAFTWVVNFAVHESINVCYLLVISCKIPIRNWFRTVVDNVPMCREQL